MEDSILNPFNWFVFLINLLAWLLSLPLRAIAWTITIIRSRRYDPEKVVCPACGFRGDSGTGDKSCIIRFIRTSGHEKGAIEHSCLRCSASFYSKLFLEAVKWMPQVDEATAAKIQQAAKRTEL